MSREKEPTIAVVMKYVSTYLAGELIQPAQHGETDPQLSTVTQTLANEIADRANGVLVDIGAGHGSLLRRLSDITTFMENQEWEYIAVEEAEKHSAILLEANRLKLLKRITMLTIEEFEAQSNLGSAPRVFFCRNVLHELTVDDAAKLIRSVSVNFREGDVFLVQDLLRFPEGERNHHCWTAEQFVLALRKIGFDKADHIPFRSPSGNAWFNLIAKKLTTVLDTKSIREILIDARVEQWRLWVALEKYKTIPNRNPLIEALDLDLQLASLTRELQRCGVLEARLDVEMEKRVRLTAILRPIETLSRANSVSGKTIDPPRRFRERGAQLTAGETFLRSNNRLALVYGGTGTGKTTFIQQLLSNRIYDKVLALVDARTAQSVWPLLEGILTQFGVRLPGDALGALGALQYTQVAPAIGKLLNRFAHRMVLVIENIDELLNSNGQFVDSETSAFLCQLLQHDGIKVIVSSKSEFVPAALQSAAGTRLVDKMRIGRFATEETVINILDDYFDRARAGLAEYPRTILEAIDRHPLIASFAGLILAQDGTGVLIDDQFLRSLRNKLRSELLGRLVRDQSRAAIEAAAEIRIPVPTAVLEQLTTRESVAAARTDDVLYSVSDRRWTELLAPIGLLKKRSGEDLMPASAQEVAEADTTMHARIAALLRWAYKLDDDPKWLRECYFHEMLSGAINEGALETFASRYYFSELVGSAEYCFSNTKDYRTALCIYNTATRLGSLDEQALMRRASSMIRIGAIEEGNEEYRRLIYEYPSNVGMCRSHVDALLFACLYQEAKNKLIQYDLAPEKDEWNTNQWGRAELGLHNYSRAIELFTKLRTQQPEEPVFVTQLARALQQFGDLSGAIAVLEEGVKTFKHNGNIATSLGVNLERAREDKRAREILNPLFTADPSNTRAALSLFRICIRIKDQRGAEDILRRAERHAPTSTQLLVHMAKAELLLDRGDAQAAVEYLQKFAAGDEATATLLIEALLLAAQYATSTVEKSALLEQAASVSIPDQLQYNAPVQIVAARLAATRRDRVRFDKILANLSRTRIDLVELDKLRTLW